MVVLGICVYEYKVPRYPRWNWRHCLNPQSSILKVGEGGTNLVGEEEAKSEEGNLPNLNTA